MNTQFQELRLAITDYLNERRNFGAQGILETSKAEGLVTTFKSELPTLADNLNWDIPDSIYAKKLITFGVTGLMNDISEITWEKYFIETISLRELAELLNYSERNVKRLVAKLPSLVAEQLFEKNFELTNRDHVEPSTIQQIRTVRLMDAFDLTKRQAEILLVFCDSGKYLGQKGICAKLQLSEAGLKKHIRKIIRKLGVSNRNEAAIRAKFILGESEPE